MTSFDEKPSIGLSAPHTHVVTRRSFTKLGLVTMTGVAVTGLVGCGGGSNTGASPSTASTASTSAASGKVSSPGQYAGYSEAVYDADGYERHSQYVEMEDGVKVAVDYYLPTSNGSAVTDPLPVILFMTPYGRASYAKDDPSRIVPKESAKELSLLQYGYVYAVCESRGTGASFGCRITTNSRREAQDNANVIEWLAAQPFCDGQVGTVGQSYNGQTQLEAISMRPAHLVASVIGNTDYNKYDGWFRNGVPRAFGSNPDTEWGSTPEEVEATVAKMVQSTVPVDDDADKTQLTAAIREHQGSLSQIEMFKTLIWRDSYCEGTGSNVWEEVSASTYKEDINATGVAMYQLAGDFDVFRRDAFTMYANVTNPKKLTLGPWYHTKPKEDIDWTVEEHRWFDYWMKGIDNGVMSEDPITIKVSSYDFADKAYCGEGTGSVITALDWPVDSGSRDVLYLGAGQSLSGSSYDNGVLTPDVPVQDSLDYQVVYGNQTSVESELTTSDKGSELDQIGLTFTSAPLSADQRIIGHPLADVSVSLKDAGWMEDSYDIDVFVTLSDYDPATGTAFQITEGQVRASLRATGECPYDFLGLPWQPCLKGTNDYLRLGKRYDLHFDLYPTAYTVKEGHCLRVTLANSIDRMYYLGRSEFEANPEVVAPTVEYFFGEDGTRIELPDIYA